MNIDIFNKINNQLANNRISWLIILMIKVSVWDSAIVILNNTVALQEFRHTSYYRTKTKLN